MCFPCAPLGMRTHSPLRLFSVAFNHNRPYRSGGSPVDERLSANSHGWKAAHEGFDIPECWRTTGLGFTVSICGSSNHKQKIQHKRAQKTTLSLSPFLSSETLVQETTSLGFWCPFVQLSNLPPLISGPPFEHLKEVSSLMGKDNIQHHGSRKNMKLVTL